MSVVLLLRQMADHSSVHGEHILSTDYVRVSIAGRLKAEEGVDQNVPESRDKDDNRPARKMFHQFAECTVTWRGLTGGYDQATADEQGANVKQPDIREPREHVHFGERCDVNDSRKDKSHERCPTQEAIPPLAMLR